MSAILERELDWLTPAGDPAVYARIEESIAQHERFLLTTHVNPDGDGLGSEIALALHLAGLGKRVRIVNGSPLPSQLACLQSAQARVETWDEEVHRHWLVESEAAFVLDTAEWSRLGRMEAPLRGYQGTLVVLDHHICRRPMGQVFLSVPGASSTGELVYRLLRRSRSRLAPEEARALYVALASDTGWFRFDNTRPDVLRIAAELVESGVFPPAIYRAIYENTSWEDVAFFRELVQRMEPGCDGRMVTIDLPSPVYERFDGRDTDRILDYALSIPATEVVLLFKQLSPRTTKISFRSRGLVDVGGIAESLGGGGHRNAAGAVVQSPYAPARERAIQLVRESLDRAGGRQAGGSS